MKRRIINLTLAVILLIGGYAVTADAHKRNNHHPCGTIHSIQVDANTGAHYGHNAYKVSSIWPTFDWDQIYDHYVFSSGRWQYNGHYTRITCW